MEWEVGFEVVGCCTANRWPYTEKQEFEGYRSYSSSSFSLSVSKGEDIFLMEYKEEEKSRLFSKQRVKQRITIFFFSQQTYSSPRIFFSSFVSI